MPITAEIMKELVEEHNVVGHLTQELVQLQGKYPGENRLIAWHPGYFLDAFIKTLPAEKRAIVAKDDFWDYSFVKQLGEVEDIIYLDPTDYPALFFRYEQNHLAPFTVDFFQEFFHKVELNVNALQELASILTKNGKPVWFTVPFSIAPDEEAKRRAILEILRELALEKPKKFPMRVQGKLYELGYDKAQFGKDEIMSLFEDILK